LESFAGYSLQVIRKVFKGSLLPNEAKPLNCATTFYKCVESAFLREGWRIAKTDFKWLWSISRPRTAEEATFISQ
jgi:hypothetical protein